MPGAVEFDLLHAEDLDLGVGATLALNPGGGNIRSTKINLATFAAFKHRGTWAPGVVAAGSYVTVTIPAPGITRQGAHVLVSYEGPTPDPQVTLHGYVYSDNEVVVVMNSNKSSGYNAGNGTLNVLVFKT